MLLQKLIWKSLLVVMVLSPGCAAKVSQAPSSLPIDEASLLAAADEYLRQQPLTITAFPAERSAGGPHDYFSEGSYWWPDPDNPGGPYIRRDGYRNPENFTEHSKAMKTLQKAVCTLVAAFKVSGDEKYARQAVAYLKAWFVHPETRMNPSLLYAQAIKGIVTGRGIGIIDTVKLIEVAQAARELERLGLLRGEDLAGIKSWFDQYATWLTTHPYGIDERDNGNNHSTWWAAQVAAYARFTGRDDLLDIARQQFKTMLPEQMAADGSFPEELARTRPYGYSLYNLDAWAMLAHIASDENGDLWHFESEKGGLRKALDFMVPFMKNKADWFKEPDVIGFENQPKRRDFLVFAGWAYGEEDFLKLWETLPETEDFPSWHLLVWTDKIN